MGDVGWLPLVREDCLVKGTQTLVCTPTSAICTALQRETDVFLAAAGRRMQLTCRLQRIWHAYLYGFVVVTLGKLAVGCIFRRGTSAKCNQNRCRGFKTP